MTCMKWVSVAWHADEQGPLRSEMDSLFTLSRMTLFIELYFL